MGVRKASSQGIDADTEQKFCDGVEGKTGDGVLNKKGAGVNTTIRRWNTVIYLKVDCISLSQTFLDRYDRSVCVSSKILKITDTILAEEWTSHRTMKPL